MKKLIIAFCALVSCFGLCAQVVITSAGSRAEMPSRNAKAAGYNTIPFMEDFSNYEGIPDLSKWEASNVVVNHSFQFNPPTVGVATLDATDLYGRLYAHASTSAFGADTLTSLPVRLDSVFSPYPTALSPGDSVYFSFYYQPAGGGGEIWESIGSQPSKADSLVLEFYSPESGWSWVWATGGEPVDSLFARNGAYYGYVLIPISSQEYFSKEFRFRFRNIASLSSNPQHAYVGNCDEWNVDYVYLNRNRTFTDTTRRDLAFVDPAPSLLKHYQAMPSRQFTPEEMTDSLQIKIVNLSDRALSSTYRYSVLSSEGLNLYTYDGGFENIAPYIQTRQYQSAPTHARPPMTFCYDINPERWYEFDILHTIKEGVGQDELPSNDTTRFKQVFKNYFAYDDGTAENGIGVEPISGAHLAVGFRLNEPDTLSRVDIYFNSALGESNFKNFYLCVWKSEDGVPSEQIYSSERLVPRSDSLNRFTSYCLEEPISLDAGMFFVSLQTVGNDYLNIGFDRNTNSSEFTYSRTSFSWKQSFQKGSVMLRPYFGYSAVGLQVAETRECRVYPNPVSSVLNMETEKGAEKSLYDLGGREILRTREDKMDVSSLECGVYILKIREQGGKTTTTKIIKTN